MPVIKPRQHAPCSCYLSLCVAVTHGSCCSWNTAAMLESSAMTLHAYHNNNNNVQVCQLMLGTYQACPVLTLNANNVLTM